MTDEDLPKRCVRRPSQRLNKGKAAELRSLIDLYAKENDDHLRTLAPKTFAEHRGHRSYRDQLVRSGYASPHGLQARMWKTAGQDAYETMARFWAAIAEDVKPLAHRKEHWSEEMCHYAFWLLFSPRRVAALYAGQTPIPSLFTIPKEERSAVVKILGREVRRRVRRFPRVRKARSACFDADMYTITTTPTGCQQVELMGLRPRQRIRVPLLGAAAISGNLRVVMEPGERVVEVHTMFDLDQPADAPDGGDAAVDIGQSEVLTDDHGKRYGKWFGKFLATTSQRDLDKGRARGKLHAVRKRALARGERAKARPVRVHNLGYQKMDRRRQRAQAECARQVNTAYHEFLVHRTPGRFAQEKLDFRGQGRSKAMSRRTVQMRNTTINERSHFKASVAGSCRQRVNPAYSSQPCPRCGYVHANNRHGDRFVCLFCGWAGYADWVGAHNLRNRMDDPEITLWMPKDRVRTILLSRFSQRTGEAPDWKPQGDCSGVRDSRHQATTARRAVGAETRVGGGGESSTVAVMDHPGQPESETGREILGRRQGRLGEGKPCRKGQDHDVSAAS